MANVQVRGFVWAIVPIGLFVVCSSSSQERSSSASCRYQPDTPPGQIGPGNRDDADYSFFYVSDYEANSQIYRRRICNHSKNNVLFDWPITALRGRCKAEGLLSEETPYFETPNSGPGPLQYDHRQVQTQAYLFNPQKREEPPKELISVLAGYVQGKNDLLPVRLKLMSSSEGGFFAYYFENDSSTPMKIYWKEFSTYWRERQPAEYLGNFRGLSQAKAITGSAEVPTFVLNPKSEAAWKFSSKARPERRYSALDVFAADGTDADLTGVAPLYLPNE